MKIPKGQELLRKTYKLTIGNLMNRWCRILKQLRILKSIRWCPPGRSGLSLKPAFRVFLGDFMKLCKYCGEQIPKNKKVCPSCGKRVEEKEEVTYVKEEPKKKASSIWAKLLPYFILFLPFLFLIFLITHIWFFLLLILLYILIVPLIRK